MLIDVFILLLIVSDVVLWFGVMLCMFKYYEECGFVMLLCSEGCYCFYDEVDFECFVCILWLCVLGFLLYGIIEMLKCLLEEMGDGWCCYLDVLLCDICVGFVE